MVNRWVTAALILTVLSLLGTALAISVTAQNTSSFLTTQTSAFFDYGTCPANRFATAITTTTLNCGAQLGVSTEAIASCPLGQFATTESANGGIACSQPNINFQNSSKFCADVTATTILMAGFKLNYTTSESGNVIVTINFQIVPSNTASVTTQYRMAYGTGNAPNCNAAKTGTQIGNLFKLAPLGVIAAPQIEVSLTVGILSLSSSTTYWFDIQMLDSSTATWTYDNPQMSVLET